MPTSVIYYLNDNVITMRHTDILQRRQRNAENFCDTHNIHRSMTDCLYIPPSYGWLIFLLTEYTHKKSTRNEKLKLQPWLSFSPANVLLTIATICMVQILQVRPLTLLVGPVRILLSAACAMRNLSFLWAACSTCAPQMFE